jgi:putative transposase
VSRLRRLYVSDRFFFVTCQLHRRRRLLSEDDFTSLAEAIQLTREAHGFLLTGWVFLPDHWHAVIFPRHPLTLSRVMEIIKVRSTHKSNLRRRESGQLWQARFFDHALRTVWKYHACLDYIHYNPVKRGLVKAPEEWVWSSIHAHRDAGPLKLAVDRVRLPTDLNARLN